MPFQASPEIISKVKWNFSRKFKKTINRCKNQFVSGQNWKIERLKNRILSSLQARLSIEIHTFAATCFSKNFDGQPTQSSLLPERRRRSRSQEEVESDGDDVKVTKTFYNRGTPPRKSQKWPDFDLTETRKPLNTSDRRFENHKKCTTDIDPNLLFSMPVYTHIRREWSQCINRGLVRSRSKLPAPHFYVSFLDQISKFSDKNAQNSAFRRIVTDINDAASLAQQVKESYSRMNIQARVYAKTSVKTFYRT